MRLRFVFLLWLAAASAPLAAGEPPRPIVGPGATKDAVIDAYGWPSGQSQAGAREILNYPQGQVFLENGRVERVDFNPAIPWPAPRPRPGPPSASTAKKGEPALDLWGQDFAAALREADRRRARILALFTGSDWSPGSRQFLDEVAFQPEFVNEVTGDFVLLRLDYPTRTPIAPELRDQNARLRERYGVTTYPALRVLSAGGHAVATVDLDALPPGETYRARVIAAVRGVREGLRANPPPPDPAPADAAPASAVPVPSAPPAPPPEEIAATGALPSQVLAKVFEARSLLIAALAAGGLIAVLLLVFVWRKRPPPALARPPAGAGQRISDAASGLPSPAEFMTWPRARLRGLAAGLAETEGFAVEVPAKIVDVDLLLKRNGEGKPSVVVLCAGGPGPQLAAKRVRELLGAMAAEGAATGWLVAPAGFAPDARAFAAEHGIVLIDEPRLRAQLRDLPPLLVPKVLARTV